MKVDATGYAIPDPTNVKLSQTARNHLERIPAEPWRRQHALQRARASAPAAPGPAAASGRAGPPSAPRPGCCAGRAPITCSARKAVARRPTRRGNTPDCRSRTRPPARARGSGCAGRNPDAGSARAPPRAYRAAATSPGSRTICRARGRRRASAHGTRPAPLALRIVGARQHRECREHVGHVALRRRTAPGQRDPVRTRRREIGERRVLQRAPPDAGAVDAVFAGLARSAHRSRAARASSRARSPRGRTRAPRGWRRRRRPPSASASTSRPAAPAPRRRRPGRHRRRARLAATASSSPGSSASAPPAPPRGDQIEQHGGRILLAGVPAHERVGVVRARGTAAGRAARPSASPAPRSRAAARAPAAPAHPRTRTLSAASASARASSRRRFAREQRRECGALRAEQPHRDRDRHRPLLRLAGRRRRGLPQRQRVAPRRRVIRILARQLRRAGLRIPAASMAERSTPEASCIAATKSSIVTAWLSWRAK